MAYKSLTRILDENTTTEALMKKSGTQKMENPQPDPRCTYALTVEDTCMCRDCTQRRKLNRSAQTIPPEHPSQTPPMADQLKSIQDEHEDQFNIAVNAAFQRGFGRWFDDTWQDARTKGARPAPFISAMFVFITTVLTKKFIGGFSPMLSVEQKEQAIMEATKLMKGYLDQIEASAMKELHAPDVPTIDTPPAQSELFPMPRAPATTNEVTSKGKKSSLILPKKRLLQ